MKKYKLMIDPSLGHKYGFPRKLPDEAVLCGGMPYDLYINPNFKVDEYLINEGYPKELLGVYRLYPLEIKDNEG
jgi:hypothetical protein